MYRYLSIKAAFMVHATVTLLLKASWNSVFDDCLTLKYDAEHKMDGLLYALLR